MTSPSSPRTDRGVRTPFTWKDIARHSWWTWAVYMVVNAAGSIWVHVDSTSASHIGPNFAVTFFLGAALTSLAVIWAYSPVAWLLGKALASVPTRAVHVLMFALAGAAALALLSLLGMSQPRFFGPTTFDNPAFVILLATSAVACGFGRWMAFRARAEREATTALASHA